MSAMKRVVVYGGSGALGKAVVAKFAAQGWTAINVDLAADSSVVVSPEWSWKEASEKVLSGVDGLVGGAKVDAVVNVAGGWAGGNVAAEDIVESSELMWKQSVQSSIIAGQIASRHLTSEGLVVLPGAAAVQAGGTSFMVGYGMAKAAVHHLVLSLAAPDSGLPEKATVVGFLPTTIDTPMNRAGMPDADFSTWTTCEDMADHIFQWTASPPASGALLKFETADGLTKVTAA
eukprot:TRINITY_DN23245_c0_g1_i1.p2 TRINITY_DN23245_c0_g1~~TRINITY_DN23245_c0_g1_i1.p2  ORF type:complete len:232 (+),score=89.40 TRINITY_DN23245_c0_g1_i1:51-746(+)